MGSIYASRTLCRYACRLESFGQPNCTFSNFCTSCQFLIYLHFAKYLTIYSSKWGQFMQAEHCAVMPAGSNHLASQTAHPLISELRDNVYSIYILLNISLSIAPNGVNLCKQNIVPLCLPARIIWPAKLHIL